MSSVFLRCGERGHGSGGPTALGRVCLTAENGAHGRPVLNRVSLHACSPPRHNSLCRCGDQSPPGPAIDAQGPAHAPLQPSSLPPSHGLSGLCSFHRGFPPPSNHSCCHLLSVAMTGSPYRHCPPAHLTCKCPDSMRKDKDSIVSAETRVQGFCFRHVLPRAGRLKSSSRTQEHGP